MVEPSRFQTPDGNLTLVHDPTQHGAIGFEGYSWHTHDDMLDGFRVEPQVQTVAEFVEALTAGRLLIAVSRRGDEISDVWITDDPRGELSGEFPKGYSVSLRYWDGRSYHAG